MIRKTPIRYAGGKTRAIKHIKPYFPKLKRLISPFFGGGSLELSVGCDIIASDINPYLISYWKYQINNPEELYQFLKRLRPEKEEYERVKDICKRWKKGEVELTDLEKAGYFFYNHNLSYGPSFIGWASSIYLNEKRYNSLLGKVRDFKANINIYECSFEVMFTKYPNDFFYLDPPYMLKKDCPTSKMFSGVYPERNKPIYHNTFNHELLRDCIKKHKGGFILSYNNCDKIIDFYKDFSIHYPSWQYTMGQGETRISKNRRDTYIKESHEVLILG